MAVNLAPTPARQRDAAAPASASPATEGSRLLWCDLVQQIGCETEIILQRSLQQMEAMLASGRPERDAVRVLRRSLQQARQVGTMSRQIARIAEGSSRSPVERMPLAELAKAAIERHAEEARARGITVSRVLPSLEVEADPALLRALLAGVVCWALTHADSAIEIRAERLEVPTQARLVCRFRHRPGGPVSSRFGGPANWGAGWQLVRHAARALGWNMRSEDAGDVTCLSLEFGCLWEDKLPPVEAIELGAARAPSSSRSTDEPGHVLLVSPAPRLRTLANAAALELGVELRVADSWHEAQRYPLRAVRAVIVDAALPAQEPAALTQTGAPRIEVADSDEFELRDSDRGMVARVGMHALPGALAVALRFALATPCA